MKFILLYLKIIIFSIKHGWIDVFWGCHASWWWHFQRFFPWPFFRNSINRQFFWNLLSGYFHNQELHFFTIIDWRDIHQKYPLPDILSWQKDEKNPGLQILIKCSLSNI